MEIHYLNSLEMPLLGSKFSSAIPHVRSVGNRPAGYANELGSEFCVMHLHLLKWCIPLRNKISGTGAIEVNHGQLQQYKHTGITEHKYLRCLLGLISS